MVTQPRRAPAVASAAVSIALIALMTLRPTSAIVITPTYCIFCGPLGGVDFILNVVLFVPLGVSLRWATGRWQTAVIVGGAITLVIETLQWRLISGRDASAGDLVANTLGTVLGTWLAVAVFRWLNATGLSARRHAAAFGIAASLVVTASAFLLQPVAPFSAQFVQWTPLPINMDPFQGNLLAVELNGRTLVPEERLEANEAFDSLTRSTPVRARIAAPGPTRPTGRLSSIVRVANDREEGFALLQWKNSAAFRTRIAAARVKLRSILIGLDGAFSDSVINATTRELVLEAYSDVGVISLRRHPDGHEAVTVPRTVGLAWALLYPRDILLNERWWPANALWLGVLVFPTAFFAVRSSRAARNSVTWWPGVLVVGALIAAPATGLSALSVGEWAGVLAGITAAWSVERLSAPHLSGSA